MDYIEIILLKDPLEKAIQLMLWDATFLEQLAGKDVAPGETSD